MLLWPGEKDAGAAPAQDAPRQRLGFDHDQPLTQRQRNLQQIARDAIDPMAIAVITRACLSATILLGLASIAGLGPLQSSQRAQANAVGAPIRIGGSSTVHPLMQQAIQQFSRSSAGRGRAQLMLSEEGTTGGLRRFCQGQLLIANASRPINRRELKACQDKGVQFLELPIAFDAITIVVNRRNTWAKLITTQELARLSSRQAQGRVTRWSQINLDWPDRPLKLCFPGSDSGTYDMFNKIINGDAGNSRQDVVSSEDDMVLVRCVSGDRNAMGYFSYGYFSRNSDKLTALSVLGQRGAVLPSVQNVQNETYMPLSRPLFLYVNDRELRRQDTGRRFLSWTLRNGLRLSRDVGLIPLPSSTYQLVESKLYRHVLGTAFGGDLATGQTVSQVLRRSLESLKRPEFR